MPTPRLLAIGDIAWDIMVRPRTELVWGSDVFGTVDLLPGGSAANVAVWAGRLGAAVTLVGKIGDDTLGDLMRRHLAGEGLDEGVVTVLGGATTRIGVLVGHHGEHAFITDHTRLLAFGPEHLATSLLDGIDVVFFNGYGVFTSRSAGFITPLLEAARQRGIVVAFDPSSFALIQTYGPHRLLEDVGPLSLLLANEHEARALTGDEHPHTLTTRADLVIVKQGGDGASAFSHTSAHRAAPVPVDLADTTGAGDAFDAAFLVNYLRHRDVERALATANRLGAYVASCVGAQPPAPDWLITRS